MPTNYFHPKLQLSQNLQENELPEDGNVPFFFFVVSLVMFSEKKEIYYTR